MVKVAGRRPMTRKPPSFPAIAPAMVTGDPLSRRVTDALGSAAPAVSVMRPRISNDGCAPAGAPCVGCCAEAYGAASASAATAMSTAELTRDMDVPRLLDVAEHLMAQRTS